MLATVRIALTIVASVLVRFSLQCTSSGYLFENHLSSNGPYRIVANKSFERIEYEECEPKKIWMIVRHGTRYPKQSTIELMNTRLHDIKGLILNGGNLPNEFIKNRDLDLLKKWKFYLDPKKSKHLAHEGEEEMLILAERMQSRFPKLFDEVYSNTSYKFKYTYSQRAQKSAYYFTSGLFGKATAKDVWYPDPSKKDPILRFYKACDKWNYDVKENPAAMQEARIFEKGPEMESIVNNINAKLNLKETPLDLDDVKLIYEMCSFETAWNKLSKSPWCSLLSLRDLKILEYLRDLKHYWKDGYGYELTYKQACPAFKDMYNFVQSKTRFPRVTVYFSHSGTILKMLAHLGLYRDDEHLTAKNYDSMSDRQWKTSLIDAFGSNLAFVSYRCGTKDKILTLHQEKIVRLPPCPDSDLCDLDGVREHYFQSINNCDFSSMCRLKDA